jgi:hypothetical protein
MKKVGVPFTPLRMLPISRGALYFGAGLSPRHCYFGKLELFGDQEDRMLSLLWFARAIGAVFPRDVALGLEIGEQREMQLTVTGEGGIAPQHSTEMPNSSASCWRNSGGISL